MVLKLILKVACFLFYRFLIQLQRDEGGMESDVGNLEGFDSSIISQLNTVELLN